MTLQAMTTDQQVFAGLKTGQQAVEGLQKEVKLDQMEDLQDKIADQMAQ